MREISGYTKMGCLLGSPVSHSISPAMHNAAFKELDIDYRYLAFDIAPEKLVSTVTALKNMNVYGFNVTMPHKNAICDLCDELSPAARISHSVNTVVNKDGYLIGHTTDGIGFVDACLDAGFSIKDKHMVLLGAGGASSSILVQSALDGAKSIDLFCRRESPNWLSARKLIDNLKKESSCDFFLHDIHDENLLQRKIEECHILVNGTSLGMAPHTKECPISDISYLSSRPFVYDLIYNPRQTKLLDMAKTAGCNYSNGLYMLLYQGAAAFFLWTGQKMPIAKIKELYFR